MDAGDDFLSPSGGGAGAAGSDDDDDDEEEVAGREGPPSKQSRRLPGKGSRQSLQEDPLRKQQQQQQHRSPRARSTRSSGAAGGGSTSRSGGGRMTRDATPGYRRTTGTGSAPASTGGEDCEDQGEGEGYGDDAQESSTLQSRRSSVAMMHQQQQQQQHQHHQYRRGYSTPTYNYQHQHQQRQYQRSSRNQSPGPDQPQHQPERQQPQQPHSIPDMIAHTALSGTLGMFKVATGLSANVLPVLWHACVDRWNDAAPPRLQDWVRILASAVRELFRVLAATPGGGEFRRRLVSTVADVVDAASSESSRQALVEVATCHLRLFAAVNAPEVHDFLDQVAVASCRALDACADFRQVAHDVPSLLSSLASVLDDPQTTIAVAQVTAYLLHALEMEQAKAHEERRRQQRRRLRDLKAEEGEGEGGDSSDPGRRRWRAERRQERSRRQAATYDATTGYAISDPGATVEQVLLSSLLGPIGNGLEGAGGGGGGETTDGDTDDFVGTDGAGDDDSSIPSKVFLGGSLSAGDRGPWDQGPAQNRADRDDGGGGGGGGGGSDGGGGGGCAAGALLHERARRGVDVAMLQRQIRRSAKSSAAASKRRQQRLEQASRENAAAAAATTTNTSATAQHRRAGPLEEAGGGQTAEDDASYDDYAGDVEDLDQHLRSKPKAGAHSGPSSPRRGRVQLANEDTEGSGENAVVADGEVEEDVSLPPLPSEVTDRKAGETSSDHFHRVLDSFLVQRRNHALKWMIEQQEEEEKDEVAPPGRPHMQDSPRTRRARVVHKPSLGEDEIVGAGLTIKQRLSALRARVEYAAARAPKSRSLLTSSPERLILQIASDRRLLMLVAVVILSFGTAFAGFACYGMYSFWCQIRFGGAPLTSSQRAFSRLLASTGAGSSQIGNSQQQEIVIRIVREVVHVNHDGKNRDATASLVERSTVSQQGVDEITKCIAESLQ